MQPPLLSPWATGVLLPSLVCHPSLHLQQDEGGLACPQLSQEAAVRPLLSCGETRTLHGLQAPPCMPWSGRHPLTPPRPEAGSSSALLSLWEPPAMGVSLNYLKRKGMHRSVLQLHKSYFKGPGASFSLCCQLDRTHRELVIRTGCCLPDQVVLTQGDSACRGYWGRLWWSQLGVLLA